MKRARNEARRMCVECRTRPARYRYRGHVRRDRSHVLCFQCYRAVRDSQRLAQPRTFPIRGLSGSANEAIPADRTGTGGD